jgi:HK97 family phage major capsid protein
MNIRALQQRKAKLATDARAMLDAVGENDFSAEDQTKFDAMKAEIAKLDGLIAREAEVLEFERSAGKASDRVPYGEARMDDPKAADPKHGFRHFGEFTASIIRASSDPRATLDERLLIGAAVPSQYGNEGTGEDGGFLVPPEFSRSIFTLSLEDDALLPMCDNVPVSGNSMVFPKDETTPWGTDGVRAYWQKEAAEATVTKPKGDTTMQRLHKLMALVPLTDELVADSMAGAAYVTPLMARSIAWKTNEAILFGDGAGQPLGMFSANCAVVQAKEAGQATATIDVQNIVKMAARLVPNGAGVWLITPDAMPAVQTMTLGNFPIFIPLQTGVKGALEGTLLGRPVYKSQHAAAFSSQGDVNLVIPSWYRAITKAGAGVEQAQSLHLYFDAGLVAFRATFRVDGQPKISKPIAQAKGANTLSPFVQLAAR